MLEVTIDEVKTNLNRLLKKAAGGESFVITESGKPVITVSAYTPPKKRAVERIGFMKGKMKVPDDFDTMGEDEIRKMFEGAE